MSETNKHLKDLGIELHQSNSSSPSASHLPIKNMEFEESIASLKQAVRRGRKKTFLSGFFGNSPEREIDEKITASNLRAADEAIEAKLQTVLARIKCSRDVELESIKGAFKLALADQGAEISDALNERAQARIKKMQADMERIEAETDNIVLRDILMDQTKQSALKYIKEYLS